MNIQPCFVIPVYNHELPLPDVVTQLEQYQIPCLLIDDGSQASCAAVIQRLAKNNSWISVVTHTHNQGKGAAIKSGLREAQQLGYSHVIQIDADGQHDLNDVPLFLERMHNNPRAVIIGQPVFDDSIPTHRYYSRYLTHIWVWINTLSFTIKDTMCGFRIYPVQLVCACIDQQQTGNRMEFDSEILVKLYRKGVSIESQLTRVSYPQDGLSHFRLWKDNVLISRMHASHFVSLISDYIPTLIKRRWIAKQRSKHWAQMEESGAYWGMLLMIKIYSLLGRNAFRLALYPVVAFYFLSNRRARTASRDYLQHIEDFDPALGIRNNWQTSFQHFYNFSEQMLDRLIVWMGKYDFEQVRFHGQDAFMSDLSQQTGAVVIGAHLGNMEICRALAEKHQKLRLNVLIHTRGMQKYNRLLGQLDSKTSMELIQVTDLNPATIISLQEKVENGEMIIMAGDRIPINSAKRIIDANFMGAPAAFSQGPYLLASLLKCRTYTFCCIKAADGSYDVYLDRLEAQLDIPRRNPQRQQAIKYYAQQYATRLQNDCMRAPLQWFNFFPFWDHPEPAAENNNTLSQ